MIIWINGAFGAGKTSLAQALAPKLPEAITFDPELLGTILSRTVPPAPSRDFQDLPIWRESTVSTILMLRRHYQADLIVPMTLVNPDYINEIFTALEAKGHKLLHVFLKVDRDTLVERIKAQIIASEDPERDDFIRQWRLAQVDRCLDAEAFMPAKTVFLDSGRNTTDQLANEVLALRSSRTNA